MAEYPSLSLRSGDLLCVNCLIAVTKHCSEAASEDAGPSGLSSQECALPTYSSTQDSATVQVTAIHLPVVLHDTR